MKVNRLKGMGSFLSLGVIQLLILGFQLSACSSTSLTSLNNSSPPSPTSMTTPTPLLQPNAATPTLGPGTSFSEVDPNPKVSILALEMTLSERTSQAAMAAIPAWAIHLVGRIGCEKRGPNNEVIDLKNRVVRVVDEVRGEFIDATLSPDAENIFCGFQVDFVMIKDQFKTELDTHFKGWKSKLIPHEYLQENPVGPMGQFLDCPGTDCLPADWDFLDRDVKVLNLAEIMPDYVPPTTSTPCASQSSNGPPKPCK